MTFTGFIEGTFAPRSIELMVFYWWNHNIAIFYVILSCFFKRYAVDIRIEFSHQLWWNTGEHGRASRLNMQVVTLQQHPVATLGSIPSSWNMLIPDILGGMSPKLIIKRHGFGALLKYFICNQHIFSALRSASRHAFAGGCVANHAGGTVPRNHERSAFQEN